MKRPFEGLRFRFRSSSTRWFTPLILIAIVYLSWFQFTVVLPSWESLSYIAGFSFLLVGPICLCAGSIAGGLEARVGWLDIVTPTTKWSALGVTRSPLATAIWCLGAYLLGLAYPALMLLFSGSHGNNSGAEILSGLAAVAATTLAGYFLGLTLRVLWLAPILTILLYGAIGFSAFGDSVWSRLTPIPDGEPSPFFPYSPLVGWMRAALYLGIAVVSWALILGSGSPHRQRIGRSLRWTASAGVLLMVVAGAWLVGTRESTPQQYAAEGDLTHVCRRVDSELAVCVNEVYASLSTEAAAVVEALGPFIRPLVTMPIRFQHDERNVGDVTISDGEFVVSYPLVLTQGVLDGGATAADMVRILMVHAPCRIEDMDFGAAAVVYAAGFEMPFWISPDDVDQVGRAADQLIRQESETCTDVQSILSR